MPQSLHRIIGTGQPQYLCLEAHQSCNLNCLDFFPICFSSEILIICAFASFIVMPSRKREFTIFPSPVYAILVILLSSIFLLSTTNLIGKLSLFAKSRSL